MIRSVMTRVIFLLALSLFSASPAWAPPIEAPSRSGPKSIDRLGRQLLPPLPDRPTTQYSHPSPSQQARSELDRAIYDHSATPAQIVSAFTRLEQVSAKVDLTSEARTVIGRLTTFEQKSRYEKVGAETNHLFFRYSSQKDFDAPFDYLLERHIRPKLQQSVDRDKALLLPFVYSSDGHAYMNSTIPQSHRIPDDVTARIERLSQSGLYAEDFAYFRGKTVIVVGHIVGEGKHQAFELQSRDGSRTLLPLLQLAEAARAMRFNWFPLGCETEVGAATGTITRINDVDALKAFKQARSTSGVSTFQQLLADLSGPDIQIAIDPTRFVDEAIIPVELQDRDGRIYGAPSSSTTVSSPTGSTGLYLLQDAPPRLDELEGPICGLGDPIRDTLSRWAWWLKTDGVILWMMVFSIASALGIIAALVEALFVPALTVGERFSGAAVCAIGGAFLTGGILMLVSGTAADGQGFFAGFFALACAPLLALGAAVTMSEDFRDFRLAGKAAKYQVWFATLPSLIALVLLAAQSLCLTHALHRLSTNLS